MKSLFKGIDPDDALREIEKAENLFGKITKDTVLKIAADPESAIHSHFEWDDSVAAVKFRETQAMTLINNIEIQVVTNGEPVYVSAYEIIPKKTGNEYVHVNAMSVDDHQYVIETALKGMRFYRNKLAIYKALSNAVQYIDSAIDELNKANAESPQL